MAVFLLPPDIDEETALDVASWVAAVYGTGARTRRRPPKDVGPHFCDAPITEERPHGCGWHGARRSAPCPKCGAERASVPLDEAAVPEGGRLLSGDPDPGEAFRKRERAEELRREAERLDLEADAHAEK